MASFRHLLTLPRPYLPPMLPFSFFIDNYSLKNVRKTFEIRFLKFLRFHTGDRTAILHGHLAAPRKGPAVCKAKAEHFFAVSCGPCQYIGQTARGRNRDTLALQSSALPTELVQLPCFRISTSKREFSTRIPKIL